MKTILQSTVSFVGAWISIVAFAQTPPSITLSPTAPSSADAVTMRIDRSRPFPYQGNSYRISQENNRIRVTLGSRNLDFIDPGLPFLPGAQFTYIELGKLPAGSYSVDVYTPGPNNLGELVLAAGIPLIVTDARTSKATPFVQLNYADHWWNPAESGWGLFIWHDRLDRLLAAWFTYGSDNKSEWYTIQAGSWTLFNRYEGQIIKTTGPAFSAFGPGSAVQTQVVGTASITFADANNGTFIYTLNGVTQSKNITRFKP